MELHQKVRRQLLDNKGELSMTQALKDKIIKKIEGLKALTNSIDPRVNAYKDSEKAVLAHYRNNESKTEMSDTEIQMLNASVEELKKGNEEDGYYCDGIDRVLMKIDEAIKEEKADRQMEFDRHSATKALTKDISQSKKRGYEFDDL